MKKLSKKAAALLIAFVMMFASMSVASAEELLGENVETIKIQVPTREIAPGVYLLPWETESDRLNNDVYQTPYVMISGADEQFAAGPLVEVEIYHVDSLNSVSAQQEGVVLATDGELFYVIRNFEEISSGTGVKGMRIEIRDYTDTRIYYGEVQVAAQFVWDGTYIMGDYASNCTYVISKPGNSNLAKNGSAYLYNNGSSLVTVTCLFSVTKHNGSSVNVGASVKVNGSGNITEYYPTSYSSPSLRNIKPFAKTLRFITNNRTNTLELR